MNIWKISIQNMKSKPLYTFLSVFILSLSIILLLGIKQLKKSFEYQMENNLGDIDMVIGAKGSPLQLVLASVLHIDNPTGNIVYQDAKNIAKNPLIKSAVPISYGDNYKGFRIVGTSDTFTSFYHAELKAGHRVKKSMEVVLGASVAKQLGLQIGDTILSAHGLIKNSIEVHEEKLTVVGILKPTFKVIDRLIITSLESVWDVHNHDKEHKHEDNHEAHHEAEDREITSLLVSFRSPRAFLTMPRKINEQTNMQAALPKFELERLYQYTGIGLQTITAIAYVILIISGIILFSSLYKMVKERSFDLAILRTYGASNFQLIKIVAYEGCIISFTALFLAFIFIKTGFIFIFKIMNVEDKLYMLQALSCEDLLNVAGLVFIITIVSILMAVYPILKMDISTILSHEK
ncbi:ABC transporter permease [Algibacter pacificus]|uniref:ABC transporter permease n=1 Tax=Algibacter pacificus TaxID=2599389 RepID=UPI0011CBAEDF|nr:ABC transporter permease [Algibacter pacificus]